MIYPVGNFIHCFEQRVQVLNLLKRDVERVLLSSLHETDKNQLWFISHKYARNTCIKEQ
jgi:hypothetical protein